MPFCSLMKGNTPTIRLLCFVLINSVFWAFYVFGSGFTNASGHFCFRFLQKHRPDRSRTTGVSDKKKKGMCFHIPHCFISVASHILHCPLGQNINVSIFKKTPREFSNKQKGHTSKLLMSLSFNYLISSVFATNKRTGWELSFICRFKCGHINSWDQIRAY